MFDCIIEAFLRDPLVSGRSHASRRITSTSSSLGRSRSGLIGSVGVPLAARSVILGCVVGVSHQPAPLLAGATGNKRKLLL
jgi:hypothetical protein